MTREIKFRSWNGYKMDYDPWASEFSGEGSPINGPIKELQENGSIVMQFTGLKDEDGKEIYEGDVLNITNNNHVVFWDEDRAMFRTSVYSMSSATQWDAEIIGNIYENPALLSNT